MVWENPQNIEKSIRRSKRELDALDKFLYGRHEADDRHLYAGTLQQKKTDVVRATVLRMHTAIENIITQGLFEAIFEAEYGKAYKKLRSQRGPTLARMLEGAGSLGSRYEAELRRDRRDHPAENARETARAKYAAQ